MKTVAHVGLLCVSLAILAPALQAQDWTFTTKDDSITITQYTGSRANVTVPSLLNGLPVVTIGDKAFWNCTNLVSVTIPGTVKNIGDYAFGKCRNLKGLYFMSSAPRFGSSPFYKDYYLTIYYLPAASGWDQECCDRPTAQWTLTDQRDAAGGVPSP